MKKVTLNQYEYGDHIKYNGNALEKQGCRLAVVLYHNVNDRGEEDLLVRFEGCDYDTDYDEDCINDGDFEDMDGWWVDASQCTFISKKEYDAAVKKANPDAVKGLPAKVYFTRDQLVIGDNPITKAEAIKFANNILTKLGKKK